MKKLGLHPTHSETKAERKRRNAVRQDRMKGGLDVARDSIPYVTRLVFDPYNMERSDIDINLFTQCSGTIIHPHFILTSKFCCNADDKVTIYLDDYDVLRPGDPEYKDNASNEKRLLSNTFYTHPKVSLKIYSDFFFGKILYPVI